MTKRRQFRAKFKFQVGREARKGTQRVPETINEIASQYEVGCPKGATQVKQWKKQWQAEGAEVFREKVSKQQQAQTAVEANLDEQIGRLKVEVESPSGYLKKKLPEASFAKRLLIEAAHPALSIRQQCERLGLNRSSYYYQPATATALNLTLMRLIDEPYTARPIYGRRKLTIYLREQGYGVNPKRVRRLMQQMGHSSHRSQTTHHRGGASTSN